MKTAAITMTNAQSLDLSNQLELLLQNMGYTREQIIHYTFLVENALFFWRGHLPADAALSFSRRDTLKNCIVEIRVQGDKCDPLSGLMSGKEDDLPIHVMVDRLLSGVGSELKYSFRKGRNLIRLILPKKDPENTLFFRNMILIMLPLALQYFFQSIATNVDAFMLGFLDASGMSAVSLIAKYVELNELIIDSICVALTAMLAQYWGKRDRRYGAELTGIALKGALLISLIFGLISFCFPKEVMSFYTNVPELITIGTPYVRLIALSFLIKPFYLLPYCILRTTGRLKQSVAYSLIGCGVNMLLNGVLIFGLFGIPKLGIIGAAIATISSGLVQVILVTLDMKRHPSIEMHLFGGGGFHWDAVVKTFLVTLYPTVLSRFSWSLGNNILTSAFGHMGAAFVAANSLLIIIDSLVLTFYNGCSASTGILIGNLLGKGKLSAAWDRSRLIVKFAFKVAFASSLVSGAIGFCLRFLPLDLNEATVSAMNILIVIYMVNIFFRCMNCFINNGFLYTGGDSKGVLVIDTVISWAVLVPLALIGTYSVVFPPVLMACILKSDEMLSFPFKFLRYKKKIWLRNLTKQD